MRLIDDSGAATRRERTGTLLTTFLGHLRELS